MIEENMMLDNLKANAEGKIIAIEGGRDLRHRLSLMGVFEGSCFRVISNHGPITLEVDRNIITIGRGMARKIRVIRL